MARAFKCDFCHNLYEKEYTQTVVVNLPHKHINPALQIKFHYIFGEAADMCEECYEKTLEAYNKEVLKIHEENTNK